jgi:hypothetical protein
MRAILFLLVCLSLPAYGQSTMPACDPNVASTSWTNCQGTETYASGEKYSGEFRDGKPNGQGTFYSLADNQFKGDRYVGEFRDGFYHGQGTYTHANGNEYVGGVEGR